MDVGRYSRMRGEAHIRNVEVGRDSRTRGEADIRNIESYIDSQSHMGMKPILGLLYHGTFVGRMVKARHRYRTDAGGDYELTGPSSVTDT